MTDIVRRMKGLPVAVAVLVITASVAFAGAPVSTPDAAADGLAVAAEAAGKVVPVGPASEEPTEEEESEEAEPAEEEAEEAEPAEEEAAEPDTHGATVSEAARMETPEGFRNHGAFVSCIARMPHGDDAPAIDLSTVTPEDCVRDDEDEDDAETEVDAETEEDAAAAPARSERGKSGERSKSGERGRGAERSAAARAGRG